MTSTADAWPVWIPLMVGLLPGFIYWVALTAKRGK